MRVFRSFFRCLYGCYFVKALAFAAAPLGLYAVVYKLLCCCGFVEIFKALVKQYIAAACDFNIVNINRYFGIARHKRGYIRPLYFIARGIA